MESAIAGDEDSLVVLLTETRVRLLADVALRMSPEFQSVLSPDDIVQDSHADVFRRIRSFEYRGGGSFYRWVLTIALRRLFSAIKFHRAQKRGGRNGFGRAQSLNDSAIALLDVLSGSWPTPSKEMARSEAVTVVQSAVAQLPEHYRHVVWAVYIDQKPIRDVAAEISRTERAVHGLCRRGLKQLRQVMESRPLL